MLTAAKADLIPEAFSKTRGNFSATDYGVDYFGQDEILIRWAPVA
jgi:hypothetical protein